MGALNKALNYPQEKQAAKLQAVKNKWSPYLGGDVRAPQTQGILQHALQTYGDSLDPATREKMEASASVMRDDWKKLVGGADAPYRASEHGNMIKPSFGLEF